jgi:ATP-dependent Clp protease adaptor protein ClpS
MNSAPRFELNRRIQSFKARIQSAKNRRDEPCDLASILVDFGQEVAQQVATMLMQFQLETVEARRRDGAGSNGADRYGEIVTERRTKEQTRTKKPPLYKCVLLNDDYTPMEFVVEILKQIFHKPHAEATRIMLHVHQNGMGVAGIYPYEIAETKVRMVEELARENQYPLKCVLEKE